MNIYLVDIDGTLTPHPGSTSKSIYRQLGRREKYKTIGELLDDRGDLYPSSELNLVGKFLEKLSNNGFLMILSNNPSQIVKEFMEHLIGKYDLSIEWINAYDKFIEEKELVKYSFDKSGVLEFILNTYDETNRIIYIDDDASYYNNLKGNKERNRIEFTLIYDSSNYIGKVLLDNPILIEYSCDMIIDKIDTCSKPIPETPMNSPRDKN